MSILERDNWTTQADLVISDIYEYDMRRGGLSIIKEKKLLSDEEISKLESMAKHDADVTIGKMERINDTLRDGKKNGFTEYRLLFGELNELTDDDIISVKKDAIFCRKYCPNNKIGTYIEFREKNHYDAFLQLPRPNKLELYWNSDTDNIDVKGIIEKKVELHKDYMLKEIARVIRKLATYDTIGAQKELVKFMNEYKFGRLQPNYFRQLNPDSTLLIDNGEFDKTFNYLNVLIPLLNIIMS